MLAQKSSLFGSLLLTSYFLLLHSPFQPDNYLKHYVPLAVTELIYRGFPVESFNQPFVPGHNFGAWFDILYGGEDIHGHWVSFNAIFTTAHTDFSLRIRKSI
jgi:hypothetical protein